MKFYYYYLLFATILSVNIFCSDEGLGKLNKQVNLELSDDDFAALESMGLSRDQAEEFSNAILNLPEEEKEALAKLSEQIQQDMESRGLDPLNPDDYFKWFDHASQEEEKEKQKKEEPKLPVEPVSKKEETKVEEIFVPESTIKDAKTLLADLAQQLAEIRQKAYATEYMDNKIKRWETELRELIYFLHILMDQDLIKHLTSKDFTKLYQNLENLDLAISKYASQIQGEIAVEQIDNPYEHLNIPTGSSLEEVESSYNDLEQLYSDENIEEKLKEKNFNEKEIKRLKKSAKISFKFIQDAYESLKDSKQKAIIDKKIKEQLQQESKLRAISDNAFDKILDILSSSIFNILQDIQRLLQKNKPDELAKAKKQEELEKVILTQTKQPIKVTPSKPGPFKFSSEKPYDSFWKQLEQDQAKKRNAAKLSAPKTTETEKKSRNALWEPIKKEGKGGDKKDEKKGDDKKGGGSDKKDEGKKASETKKSESKGDTKKESPSDDSKALETSVIISNIADILENAKDEIEEVAAPKRKGPSDSETQEPAEPKKVKLKELAKQVNTYLTDRTIDEQDQSIKNLAKFVDANKIEKLWEDLSKINPGPQGKLDPSSAKVWKEKAAKHEKKINEWYTKLAKEALAPNADRPAKNLSPVKNKLHSVDAVYLKDMKDFKKKLKYVDPKIKGQPEYKGLEPLNLGVLRKYLFDIKEAFDNIKKSI